MLKKFKGKTRTYWLAVLSQVLLVIQLGAKLFFDYTLTEDLKAEIVIFVDAVLVLTSFAGIVSDPNKPKIE
jgi:uncharacterized membrane protein